MSMHEHFELLTQLKAEYQEKLDAIDPGDQEAIDQLAAEFKQAILGAGAQFNPKTRVFADEKGRTRIVWD